MPQLLPGTSLSFLLTDLSRLYRQSFERAVEGTGLAMTPGEIRALAFVARFPGSRQAVLAELMGVEPMTLSAYLDRLETHCLIERGVDPTDRRAKIITTTKNSARVFDQVRPRALEVFQQATRTISVEDIKLMQDVLVRIRSNLTGDRCVDSQTDEIADDGTVNAASNNGAVLQDASKGRP